MGRLKGGGGCRGLCLMLMGLCGELCVSCAVSVNGKHGKEKKRNGFCELIRVSCFFTLFDYLSGGHGFSSFVFSRLAQFDSYSSHYIFRKNCSPPKEPESSSTYLRLTNGSESNSNGPDNSKPQSYMFHQMRFLSLPFSFLPLTPSKY